MDGGNKLKNMEKKLKKKNKIKIKKEYSEYTIIKCGYCGEENKFKSIHEENKKCSKCSAPF